MKKTAESQRAQAVLELAIFGAILIFLIGSLIQQGASASYQQNFQLQSMRRALLKSYQTSYGLTTDPHKGRIITKDGNSSRNNASFLILEDRLSPAVTRYGVLDRQPIMIMGGGSMTNRLYNISDWDQLKDDIPVMDMKINGQAFKFKNAATIVYRVKRHADGSVEMFRISNVGWEQYMNLWMTLRHVDDYLMNNKSEALKEMEEGLRYRDCSEASSGSPFTPPGDVNTARVQREWNSWHHYALYASIQKNVASATDTSDKTSWAFVTANGNGDTNLPRSPGWTLPQGVNAGLVIWKWRVVSPEDAMSEIDWDKGEFPGFDIDGDMQEEVVYHITKYNPGGNKNSNGTCNGDQIYDLGVMDYSIGEMNSGSNTPISPEDEVGVKRDTHIYSITENGTAMEVREGATFVGSQKLTTSFANKRQYDIISRAVQLNRNMVCENTLCNPSYKGFSDDPAVQNELVRCDSSQITSNNVASCCAEMNAINLTCFDMTNKRLYVRSRIRDRRGRIWVTEVHAPDAVQTPVPSPEPLPTDRQQDQNP